MEKNKFFILGLCLCFSLIFHACSSDNMEEQTTDTYRHDKTAVSELSDGWFFFCDYEEIYNADGSYLDTYCTVDGANLKYQNLSDFNISIINSDTGEVTGYITPSVNSLCMNKNYNDKLTEVSQYLKCRENNSALTEEELSFIDTEDMIFRKSDVVNIYNTAMKNLINSNDSGKYLYISFSDIRKGTQVGDYHWQVGYLIFTGNIAAINIELIYSDGKYLSNIDSSNLTKQQEKLIFEIEKVENNIMNQQTFIPTGFDFTKTVGEIELNKLLTVLNSIEVDNEANKDAEN